MTAASVEVSVTADLAGIAAAAGNATLLDRWYAPDSGGTYRLFVRGVTQEALDAAAARLGSAPPAPPVPDKVRMLAFLKAATRAGFITREDALAAARTGAIPQSFEPILSRLPVELADDTRLDWAGMVDVERKSRILAFLARQKGISQEALDALFRLAAEIESSTTG